MTGRVRAIGVAVAGVVLLVWYGTLLAGTARISGMRPANERVERTELYGSEANAVVSAGEQPGNRILLHGGRSIPASATWNLTSYEFRHDLAHASDCRLTFYAIGLDARAEDVSGTIRVLINGRRIDTIRFARAVDGSFPYAPNALRPAGVDVSSIELSPLDRAHALTAPLDRSFCSARQWTITIEATKARWSIDRVGLIARFTPVREALLGSFAADGVVAAMVLFAIVAGAGFVLTGVAARYGFVGLASASALLALAPLGHDQWDFPIWLRFTDIVAIGHASPAGMWFGTPLWAFLPAIFAPVLTASNASFGNESPDLVAVLLKGTMALAAIFNAMMVASFAPRSVRNVLFTIALAAPIALYQVGAGYREVFAMAFVLVGLRGAFERRYVVATFAIAAGASISESLLPLVLFPAALTVASPDSPEPLGRRAARGLALAVAGLGVVAIQWLTLLPKDVATYAVSNRVMSYRFGGGSWYSGFEAFGILPDWVGRHSFAVVLVLFALFSAWPAFNAVRAVAARAPGLHATIFRAFVAVVAAFFMSYRGIDPNTWYVLFLVSAVYFARYDPTNPFPLVLGTVCGAAFYAIVGLGDFVNWTFLWPHDVGLLGILGRPVYALVLTVNGLFVAFYLAMTTNGRIALFSRRSSSFVLLFAAAIANAAIRDYATDVIFCTAAMAISSATIWLMLDARKARGFGTRVERIGLSTTGYATTIVAGAAYGAANAAAGLVASTAMLVAFDAGFGTVDIVLVAGATSLLAVQHGFGPYSIFGWIAISLVASNALFGVVRAAALRPTT